MNFFSKKRKKALIIGIDGVPHDLLVGMIEKGAMGGLAAALKAGHATHRMKASLPEISSVSWTSFMTGVNPGEHGIFGFTHLQPFSYRLHFTSSKDIKAPTFWQTLSKKDSVKKTLILNLPSTYPAFPIEGLLVSGFVAVDFEKAVYPPSYVPLLKKMNYMIDVEAEKARKDKSALYQDILQSLSIRQETALALFDREPWDLALVCVTETDRLHHFFFDEKDTETFDRVYRKIDEMISALYQAAQAKWGGEFLFLVLSDHGFCLQKQEVNLNAYLRRAGMLTLDPRKEYYEKIASGTSAFAMDPGRIYVHDEKRFPRGHVKLSQVPEVKEELKTLLFELKTQEGEPVLQSVFDRDEIYRGPFTEAGPDLVCLPNRGYDLKGNLRKNDIFTSDIFTGMHTWDDAVLILPSHMKPELPMNVEFPTKVILDYFLL
jgi:predicted AlkP superfamily phosphohydrolase/phosphomutase